MGEPYCKANKKWQRNDHICQSCCFWNMKDNCCERFNECERPKRRDSWKRK